MMMILAAECRDAGGGSLLDEGDYAQQWLFVVSI